MVILPSRQPLDLLHSTHRVSLARAARQHRLQARRVRLANPGRTADSVSRARPASRDRGGSLVSRMARSVSKDSPDNADRRASRDNPARRDRRDNPVSQMVGSISEDNPANRDRQDRRDRLVNVVVSLVNRMDSCEHRGNQPVPSALRDSRRPANRARPNRQRARSRNVLTPMMKRRRVSARNRGPAQFRLNKRPSQYSAASFKGCGYCEAVCTTGNSTKLTAGPPSNILMVAFL